jgi:hypothetical protein
MDKAVAPAEVSVRRLAGRPVEVVDELHLAPPLARPASGSCSCMVRIRSSQAA